MRRIAHRILSAAPIVVPAFVGVWATTEPAKARALFNKATLMLSDARFFWLCLVLIAGYALLWWVTSIEPKTQRQRIQSGLRLHFEVLTRMVHQFKAAQTYKDVQALIPPMDAALTEAGNWLRENMAPAAFEKFKTPPTGTSVWSFPGESSEAAEHRSNIVVLNEARLAVLDTFLRYDGWDPDEASVFQNVKVRLIKWKKRNDGLTRS